MLEIRRIQDSQALLFHTIDELYEISFPHHEKRDAAAKQVALADNQYSLDGWYDKGNMIGFIGYWNFQHYVYIEHFAVNSQLRGKGYGSIILQQFCLQHPLIILEIDPLNSEIAHKRLAFYQRLGFQQNDMLHFHPSYHKGIADHQLLVLSYPRQLEASEYAEFNQQLHQRVMNF